MSDEQGQWQPIKTAPVGKPLFGENGPPILLGWVGSDHIAIGSFRSYGNLGAVWRDVYGGAIIEPTHWMPLPAPPAQRSDDFLDASRSTTSA